MLQPEVTLPHKFNFSPSSFSSLYKPPASPSYHLSRPAHVSVVREVPGIHKFAQYSYSALLCKGILMSPSLQHCSVVGQRYSTPRRTAPSSPVPLCHSSALARFHNSYDSESCNAASTLELINGLHVLSDQAACQTTFQLPISIC